MPTCPEGAVVRRSLVGAVLVAVALTGCGAEPDRAPGRPGELSGRLTVAAAGGEGELAALQAVADAFEAAHAGTEVRLDTVAEPGELVAALTTSFAGGSPPDVFVLNYRRLGAFAAKDVVEPVPAGAAEGLYAQPLEAFTFDGSLLCLPSNASSMVVYLNPALFERAGVPLPQPDWTSADLLRTAEALEAGGVPAIGFDPTLIRLAPFVWSAGGEVVDDADRPTVVDLSAPEDRSALQLLLDLQAQGLSATDRAARDAEESFLAGVTAMHLDSRRAVPGFRATEGLSFDVAPVPTDRTSVSVLHSDGYCVAKASSDKELARAFADFAVNGDGSRVLAEAGRTVPMRRSVAQSPAFLAPDEDPRSSQVFLDQLDDVRALPHVASWNEAESAVDDVLAQLFAGKTTLDAAVRDIATESRRALAAG